MTNQIFTQPELSAAHVDRNVVFGMYSGLALLMDVYYPDQPNGYGIIHIAGSGWTRPLGLDATLLSRQNHVKLEGEKLLAAGYTLFTINHRAAPRFIFPAAIQDAQRAVRFIRYHAEKYNIDPNRIGAIGGSSGGHLVSLLGVLDGDEWIFDDSPVNRQSAKVQCVIARAAPSNLQSGIGVHFLGTRFKEIQTEGTEEHARARHASPMTHVTADDAPMLLVHGDKDESVPFALSQSFQATLSAAGVPTKLIGVVGAGHGPSFPKAVDKPDLGAAYVQWMDIYLRQK
ncbi:MAG: alpha/beta hydrolase [Saprospiraceae bacterium]|nr:alpha/beta hydrolase [Saprospiraceae bacterium]